MDTAQAAFKYRYVVIGPPQVPKRPVRPVPLLVGGLGPRRAAARALRRGGHRPPIGPGRGDGGRSSGSSPCRSWANSGNEPAPVAAPRRLRPPGIERGQASARPWWSGLRARDRHGGRRQPDGRQSAPGRRSRSLGAVGRLAGDRGPLRWSATALLFLSLALDDRSSAEGRWHTPLSILGDFLHFNIDSTFRGASGLKVNGHRAVVVVLLGLVASCGGPGETGPTPAGQVPIARVMRDFALILVLALLYGVANGIAHRGESAGRPLAGSPVPRSPRAPLPVPDRLPGTFGQRPGRPRHRGRRRREGGPRHLDPRAVWPRSTSRGWSTRRPTATRCSSSPPAPSSSLRSSNAEIGRASPSRRDPPPAPRPGASRPTTVAWPGWSWPSWRSSSSG